MSGSDGGGEVGGLGLLQSGVNVNEMRWSRKPGDGEWSIFFYFFTSSGF